MAGQSDGARWGAADERGALNLLEPERVLEAAHGCRTGRVYQLGLPVQRSGMPTMSFRGTPQRLTLLNSTDDHLARLGAPEGIGVNEDMLTFATHNGTHIDALCHVHAEGAVYNGFPADGMTSFAGAKHCGIEKAGAFAARGVLLDVAGCHEVMSLRPSYTITAADLDRAAAWSGTEVRSGDAVLIRTGWVEAFLSGSQEMTLRQPGIGLDAARWLADRDVTAVGSDNSTVEVTPFDRDVFLGVHIELLVKRGIYLIEHLMLGELSADSCWEFLLCVAPLLITGATGSPVNPVAIG